MIGEYVGNQDYQHLVKYQKTTILFYAIVDNCSKDTCIPLEQAFGLLRKYNFDTVTVTEMGSFTTFESLAAALCELCW